MVKTHKPKLLIRVTTALLGLIAIIGSGCTSINVRPVDSSLALSHVYIQKNNSVAVQDFLTVLVDGFSRHGISTTVVTPDYRSQENDFILLYTAFNKWDFTTYLSSAEIELYRDKKRIGYAQYHLVGGGGLSLFKWQGTEAKIDPVIDELLQNYKLQK